MKKIIILILAFISFECYSQYPVKVDNYVVSSDFSFYKADLSILYLDTTFSVGKQVHSSWLEVPMKDRPKIILLDEKKFDKILFQKTKIKRKKNQIYYAIKFA